MHESTALYKFVAVLGLLYCAVEGVRGDYMAFLQGP